VLVNAHVWGPGAALELAPAALSLATGEDKVPGSMQELGSEQTIHPPVQLESCTVLVPCSTVEVYAAAPKGKKARQELQVGVFPAVMR
jgi:hypothetical protein